MMLTQTTPRLRRLIGTMTILLIACGDGASTGGPPGAPGPAGPEGPEGPAAEPDEPSITGISPGWVWLSRSATIAIGGYDTAWDSSTSVDFGAGITVEDLVVASPTSLVATVTSDTFAAVGPRDVVVTSGDVSLTHTAAFEVRPGADVGILLGDGTQGSFNVFVFDLHDAGHSLTGGVFDDPAANPFSTVIEGAGEEILHTQDIAPIFVDEHVAVVSGFLDVTAPATAPLSLVTDPGVSDRLVSTGILEVLPSTPLDLTLGVPLEVTYGNVPYATKLLRYTNDSGEDALVSVGVGAGSGGQEMFYRYARHGGRIADGYAFTIPGTLQPVPVRDGEDVYLMAFAPDGGTGFTFEAGAVAALPASFYASEELDDDTCANAQNTALNLSAGDFMAIDGGVLRTGSDLLGDTEPDTDWYRLSVVSEDVMVSCLVHSNHDSVTYAIYEVGDCETPAATTLGSGDYYLALTSEPTVTTHGAGNYAVMCGFPAAP